MSKVWRDDGGFVHIAYEKGSTLTLDIAKEDVATVTELGGGRPVPLVVHLAGVKSSKRDARAYYASEASAAVFSAVAVITSSSLERVVANFFIGFNRPPMPMRVFDREAEAFAWLRERTSKAQ
jgi:hypothetical protein